MILTIVILLALPPLYVGLALWRLRVAEGTLRALPQPPPSRPGLWMMAHRADKRLPLQHLFMRLTPSDDRWARERPDLFGHRDAAGLAYCTLGAGPVAGLLVLAFNRPTDLADPISFEEALPLAGPDAENRSIQALITRAGQYPNHLRFSNWTRVTGRGFNCNSIMASLVKDCGLPWPRFVRIHWLAVGYHQRVPKKAFRPVAQ
jgi:hypothetical protein